MIEFNGPKTRVQTYDSFNSQFISSETFIPGVESLHLTSDRDQVSLDGRNDRLYEAPLVVKHD